MDSIFGIGLPELILILIIAGVVMGPERIVRAARSLGLLVSRMQVIGHRFVRQLTSELESIDEGGEFKSTAAEFEKIRREMADIQKELRAVALGTAAESRSAVTNLKDDIERSIMPDEILGKYRKELLEIETALSSIQPESAVRETPTAPAPLTPAAANGRPAGTKTMPNLSPLPRRLTIPEDPEE